MINTNISTLYANEFATESSTNSLISASRIISSAEMDQIEKNREFLRENFYVSAPLVNIDVNDNEIQYQYLYDDGTLSNITVTTLENSDTYLDIKEGDKHDTLLYCSDGSVVYNGCEIVSADSARSIKASEEQQRAYTEYVSNNAPYGSASEYNVGLSSNPSKNPNVHLGKMVKDCTKAGFEGALTSAVLAVLNVPAAIIAGFFTAFFYKFFDYMVNTNPTETAASFKINQFYHESSGKYRINSMLSAKKVSGMFYTAPNYDGKAEGKTFYLCVDHT